jgi:myosin-5
MVAADVAIRQKRRLQSNRASNAAPTSHQQQQQRHPELPASAPVQARMIQMRNDGNVEVSGDVGVGNHVTTAHQRPQANSSRGKERHAPIPSSSIAEQRYFNKHNQLSSSSNAAAQQKTPGGRVTPPQSRNDNDSWFQYTNGTNMRSTTVPKVSKKVTTKIDDFNKNPQTRQQQRPASNTATSDFDTAWASFSDSAFDNSFARDSPFSNGGTLDWPTDDDRIDVTSNSTRKIHGGRRSEDKSVAAATPPTTTTKTTKKFAAKPTFQSKPLPQKETEVISDVVEFWDCDEIANLTGLDDDWGGIQSDKESDIAALFNYRNGGKRSGNKLKEEQKLTFGGSSGKATNSASSAVTQNQGSSSKLTTATCSKTLGTTAKLKSFFEEGNSQQQLLSSKVAAVTSSQAPKPSFTEKWNGQQQHSLSKLTTKTTTTRSETPTSAIAGPYCESPAKPTNLETNRFKSMPRVNSNSYKTSTSSPTVHSASSPTPQSLPPYSSSSSAESSKKTALTGNSLAAYKKYVSKSSLPQQHKEKTISSVHAPPPSPFPTSPPITPKKKLVTASYLVTPERKTVTPSSSQINSEQPPTLLTEVSSRSISSKVTKPERNIQVSNSIPLRTQAKPAPRVGSSFRKRTLPPKPYMKPSSPSKSNSSIVIKNGGTPVWVNTTIFNDSKNVDAGMSWNWVRAYLSAAADDTMEVTVDDPTSNEYNGKSYTISKCYNDGERILMGNTWWSSPPSVDGGRSMPPEDLVELTHLHEPAIVCALEARYQEDIIYTNTGSILLAVNPFKKIDNLYTLEMMERYWNHDHEGNIAAAPPPHAFAVAELAFSSMMRSLEERDADALSGPPCNQSILVSGESGAGKTVNTKIVMRYLTLLSQRHMHNAKNPSRTDNECLSVETQVLQSNPILESFGNARTIRNDNSSRFGKFIEMSFQAKRDDPNCSRGTLLGASIDFYLLEKVRLVSVNPGERNYHVFYEITCPRGMSIQEKKRYKLTSSFGIGDKPLTAADFNMTSVSGTFDRRDGVVDMDTYHELRMAMDSVGFVNEEQESIFRVTAALLHASNLRFESRGSDDCFLVDGDGTLDAVADLLGVSVELLQRALTSSMIEARGEVLVKRLSPTQAIKALEAFIKATYGALFECIVRRINQSIEVHGDVDDFELNKATIGVLDIFGFESFQTNSFEQLCINYCNEALQQQFAKFVFKAEQAEYEEEGIGWSNIDFPDNQERLDLIEAKRVGIFSVLDEQCRLPMRTDQTFAKAVHDLCEKNEFYVASQMQQSKGSFAIVHYAGEVEYDSSGFIIKNKDELPKGTFDLLSSSSSVLVSELACIMERSDDGPATSSGNNSRVLMRRSSSTLARATVCGQFSSQLRVLRSRIEMTEPHYIRCLKPNDRLVADSFDRSLISHQLNCAGVLPAMKIARAGFAMRYLHSAFDQRFSPIVNKQVACLSYRRLKQADRTKKLVELLAPTLEAEMKDKLGTVDGIENVVSWGVQIGKTKVFLRAAAFDALEELRYSSLNKAATIIQANARTFL